MFLINCLRFPEKWEKIVYAAIEISFIFMHFRWLDPDPGWQNHSDPDPHPCYNIIDKYIPDTVCHMDMPLQRCHNSILEFVYPKSSIIQRKGTYYSEKENPKCNFLFIIIYFISVPRSLYYVVIINKNDCHS